MVAVTLGEDCWCGAGSVTFSEDDGERSFQNAVGKVM